MNSDHNFLDDFRAACEDLIGDVVLLESLILCREQWEHRQSPEQFALLVCRVTDYLKQHTEEVLQLTNR